MGQKRFLQQPRRVSVVGLGKLGAPIAVCLAAKGFQVVGVDSDPAKVDAINRNEPPVYEPGLSELLPYAKPRLLATQDLAAAIHGTDLTMLIVPTPSAADGTFSLQHILAACRTIGKALRTKKGYHVVSITSTVMPGATAGEIQPLLEQTSGKSCGGEWGLCYSPEFVALGSVIHDFLKPDFLLIGESDPHAGDHLEAVYQQLYSHDPPVSRMTFVNAELAKIAVNTYITTKITFANMLAGICQRLPGANVDAVTAAMGLDSRIGRKYLRGAVGYGGPCFPRDNVALSSLMHRLGAPARLAETVDRANRDQVRQLAKLVKAQLGRRGTVGVLGLAYKPNTDVVEQSQGVLLASALAEDGIEVAVYDPAAMENARAALPESVRLMPNLAACVEAADVLVLVTPWDEFKTLDAAALARAGRSRVLVDCWRCFEADRFEPEVRYVAVGVGPQSPEPGVSKQVA